MNLAGRELVINGIDKIIINDIPFECKNCNLIAYASIIARSVSVGLTVPRWYDEMEGKIFLYFAPTF